MKTYLVTAINESGCAETLELIDGLDGAPVGMTRITEMAVQFLARCHTVTVEVL
jgi:hypothetical protein